MESLFHLILTTGDRLGAFITRLEELQDEDFPTRGSKALVELFLKVCLYFTRILKEQSEYIKENKGSEESIKRQIKMIANKISILSAWLRFIDTSKPEYAPIEFAKILDTLSKKLYINGEVIVRPQSQYNWEFREIVSGIKEILKKEHTGLDTEGIFQNSPDFIVVLSFPNIEKDNLFLHIGLLIHEFGHYFDIINKISAQVEISFDDVKLNELIDYQFKKIRPKPGEGDEYKVKTQLKIYSKERLQKLLFNWIQESIADLIAIHIGGPGAFFAFADQAIIEPSLDDYTVNERYPSFRIRLLIMLEELRKIGFVKKKFKEWHKDSKKKEVSDLMNHELLKWEKSLKTAEQEKFFDDVQQKEIETIKKSFLEIFPTIRDNVMNKLNEFENSNPKDIFRFDTDLFEREVFHLVDLIKKGISPNEIILRENIKRAGKSEPAKWASILNAGWLWIFIHLDKSNNYTEDYILKRSNEKNEMFLHIIKAIERSEIQKQFLNIKSKFGD